MEANLTHLIALVVGGTMLCTIIFYLMKCRGDLGRAVIFIIAILCMVMGAFGQFLFEDLSSTYQIMHDANKIDAELFSKLASDAKLWSQILGTTFIGLGVGLLVAYLSHKPVKS
ncbi:hypothetical protein HaloA020_23190 [Halomonas sp. A020]|uniref:hypothetical protein n=1 Tax=Halomonas sp. A020 TaxID=2717374 RepID=UPI002490A37D|nr:hypothetical protein [Halomonas sp. A020]BCB61618.1 hypothetical protein HaloA020_23190 [Halomonas sp. A020]